MYNVLGKVATIAGKYLRDKHLIGIQNFSVHLLYNEDVIKKNTNLESLVKYLLSTDCMPVTGLGCGYSVVIKMDKTVLPLAIYAVILEPPCGMVMEAETSVR